MHKVKKFNEFAEKAEKKAGKKVDLSGAGFDLAVKIVSKHWVHGEEFSKWYKQNEAKKEKENQEFLKTDEGKALIEQLRKSLGR